MTYFSLTRLSFMMSLLLIGNQTDAGGGSLENSDLTNSMVSKIIIETVQQNEPKKLEGLMKEKLPKICSTSKTLEFTKTSNKMLALTTKLCRMDGLTNVGQAFDANADGLRQGMQSALDEFFSASHLPKDGQTTVLKRPNQQQLGEALKEIVVIGKSKARSGQFRDWIDLVDGIDAETVSPEQIYQCLRHLWRLVGSEEKAMQSMHITLLPGKEMDSKSGHPLMVRQQVGVEVQHRRLKRAANETEHIIIALAVVTILSYCYDGDAFWVMLVDMAPIWVYFLSKLLIRDMLNTFLRRQN